MSSNLPPGVTDQMIEDFAARESLLEAFERYLNKQEGGKTREQEGWLRMIYSESGYQNYPLHEFVERAMEWANDKGYDQGYKEGHYSATQDELRR